MYLFEDYALDTDRRKLVKADRSIVVRPPVFDVLALLIANRGRVVTKDELIEAVWDGRISFIRDYRHVGYVVDDAELILASGEPSGGGAPHG